MCPNLHWYSYPYLSVCMWRICVFVYVCMCVCVYVCLCTCTCVRAYVRTCVRVYVCTCVSMHGCMDAWMHGCMDAWMDGWMDVCRPFAVVGCLGVWGCGVGAVGSFWAGCCCSACCVGQRRLCTSSLPLTSSVHWWRIAALFAVF